MFTQLLVNIFSRVDSMLSDEEFIKEHKVNPSDFTRKRCLDFKSLVWFLICHTKRSLQIETGWIPLRFGDKMKSFSPQALSKARTKMKPDAIYSISRETAKIICQNILQKTFRGFRVHAVDGTKILLPDTEVTRKAFGTGGNHLKTMAMAGSSILYDTLNDIVLDMDIVPVDEPERETLLRMLKRTGEDYVGQKRLLTLDRGYPSRELFHFLQENGYKYVIRMTNAYNTPKYIRETTQSDSIVTDNKDKTLTNRVIRILLDSGEEELLVTNLYDETFSVADFYELYHLRWPIETKYGEFKHKFYFEKFTGNSPCAIQQDFFIMVFLSNLTALVKQSGEEERKCDHKERNKWGYTPNRNTVIAIFMQYLPQLLYETKKRYMLLLEMLRIVKTKCSAVRNDRHAKRIKKQTTRTYRMNQK